MALPTECSFVAKTFATILLRFAESGIEFAESSKIPEQ
jgi:hypothetical protein